MKKMNLKKTKEVSTTDQFLAVVDLLNALGYDISQLTILDAAVIKHDIIKAIEAAEELEPIKSDDQVTRW